MMPLPQDTVKGDRQVNFTRYSKEDVEDIISLLKCRRRPPKRHQIHSNRRRRVAAIGRILKKNRTKILPVIVVFVAVVLLYLASLGFVRLNNGRIIATASRVKLRSEEKEVWLSKSRGSYDAIVKFIAAVNSLGVTRFDSQWYGFCVPSGTKALVVGVDKPFVKVKILEGRQKGQFGWVLRDSLE